MIQRKVSIGTYAVVLHVLVGMEKEQKGTMIIHSLILAIDRITSNKFIILIDEWDALFRLDINFDGLKDDIIEIKAIKEI